MQIVPKDAMQWRGYLLHTLHYALLADWILLGGLSITGYHSYGHIPALAYMAILYLLFVFVVYTWSVDRKKATWALWGIGLGLSGASLWYPPISY